MDHRLVSGIEFHHCSFATRHRKRLNYDVKIMQRPFEAKQDGVIKDNIMIVIRFESRSN